MPTSCSADNSPSGRWRPISVSWPLPSTGWSPIGQGRSGPPAARRTGPATCSSIMRRHNWDAGVLYRYVEGGTYDNTYVQGVDINNNHVGGRSYFDLNGSYKLSDARRDLREGEQSLQHRAAGDSADRLAGALRGIAVLRPHRSLLHSRSEGTAMRSCAKRWVVQRFIAPARAGLRAPPTGRKPVRVGGGDRRGGACAGRGDPHPAVQRLRP